MSPQQPSPGRRAILSGTATLGAVAAGALLGTPVSQLAFESMPKSAVPAKAMGDKGGGYHVTEHVQDYYRSARI